jgi:eukaryotic-like serine/threonine-protein kinase
VTGTTIAHYDVLEKLGEGGMGVVYKARDTRLERDVAIKVLPPSFAADSARMERFQREARTLASLNHSGIAAIYGLEESESIRAIVMELAEGETLAERIARGPIPVEDALKIALQIAEALEAAHEKGIIHRDLKPGNIMVSPDGQVKVLDFGLAKALEGDAATADPENSPTVTIGATQAGVILGTAGYMSPEQARGQAADRRADIWAFGVVLFEMLAGRRAFVGKTTTDVLASVVKEEPDWPRLPAGTLPAVRRLLRRCLTKEPKKRLQAIGDARIEIEDGIVGKGEGGPSAESRTALSPALLTVGACALVCLALLAFWFGRQTATIPARSTPAGSDGQRLTLDLSDSPSLAFDAGTALVGYESRLIDISPDGERVVYVGLTEGEPKLYLRELRSFAVRQIPGTEGAIHPFFSPSGSRVGFLTNDKLKTVALGGGKPLVVCDVSGPIFGRWLSEDTIHVVDGVGYTISSVPATGGEKQTSLSVWSRWQHYSDVLPGGKFALSTHRPGSVSGDHGKIHLISLEGGEAQLLIANGYGAKYSTSGHLVYGRAGDLYAVGFNLEQLEVRGEPRIVASDVRMDPMSTIVQAAVSTDGAIVYVPGGGTTLGRLTWVDRSGRTEFLSMPEAYYGDMDIAPDGRRIAVHVHDVSDYIQIYEPGMGVISQIEGDSSFGWPVWSRNGDRIAFTSKEANGTSRVLVHSINSGTSPKTVLESDRFFRVSAWTPDETQLVAYVDQETFLINIEAASGSGVAEPAGRGWGPDLSPNGKWLALSYRGAGVTVRPLGGAQSYQVSQGAGYSARWCQDCDQLFYREGNRFFASRVRSGPKFQWERPEKVFEVAGFIDTWGKSFDVSPDGERLLVVKRERVLPRDKIHVVQNWAAFLEDEQ